MLHVHPPLLVDHVATLILEKCPTAVTVLPPITILMKEQTGVGGVMMFVMAVPPNIYVNRVKVLQPEF